MRSRPILPDKVTVTINTVVKLDGPNFVDELAFIRKDSNCPEKHLGRIFSTDWCSGPLMTIFQ